jgi:ATP-dependent DNA helicase RecQ
VIFSDVSLREMARNYPTTASEFRRIPGVGEQKLKDFAKPFLNEINNYLATNPRREFREVVDPLTAFKTGPGQRRSGLNESQLETLQRFRKGESVDQIARARGFVRSTIYGHLVTAIECGKIVERDKFFTLGQEKEIAAAFRQVSDGKLTDVSAFLGGKYDIGDLRVPRVYRARIARFLRREAKPQADTCRDISLARSRLRLFYQPRGDCLKKPKGLCNSYFIGRHGFRS